MLLKSFKAMVEYAGRRIMLITTLQELDLNLLK